MSEREIFAQSVAYRPYLIANYDATPIKDYNDFFNYIADVSRKYSHVHKAKLRNAYRISGEEVMYRLKDSYVIQAEDFWEIMVEEFALFMSIEFSATGQRFLKGVSYYIRGVSKIATQYMPSYMCHLILTSEGDTGKTFFLKYLSRAILKCDQDLKLTYGKEIGRNKEEMISACKILDENFSVVPKNSKTKSECEAVR